MQCTDDIRGQHSHVCSTHFDHGDIVHVRGQPQLKPCAVPKRNEVNIYWQVRRFYANLSQIASAFTTQFDMQRTCRLCLRSDNNLKHPFDSSEDDNQPSIAEQLLAYANIQVFRFVVRTQHTNKITCCGLLAKRRSSTTMASRPASAKAVHGPFPMRTPTNCCVNRATSRCDSIIWSRSRKTMML